MDCVREECNAAAAMKSSIDPARSTANFGFGPAMKALKLPEGSFSMVGSFHAEPSVPVFMRNTPDAPEADGFTSYVANCRALSAPPPDNGTIGAARRIVA